MADAFPPPASTAESAAPPAAPPGAYTVPVGGYQVPTGGYRVPSPPAPTRRTGLIAALLAGLASVAAPIAAGILSLRIGLSAPAENVISTTGSIVWSALTPVRTQVLWLEIVFWSASVLGILALMLGTVATVRRHGRTAGISAIALAAVGPIIFVVVAWVLYSLAGVA